MHIKNLIFDLYETLIDIRTDESALSFWKGMAQLYGRCGAVYKPEELHQAYLRLVDDEQERLKIKSGLEYPEIDLEIVFRRLLEETPVQMAYSKDISDDAAIKTADNEKPGKKAAETGTAFGHGGLTGIPDEKTWTFMIANAFRSMSMRRFKLYPGTLKTMKKLKADGYRLYLLSNAQSIFTRPELNMTGLTEVFDALYISSEKGMKKPQPEFMQCLLDEQGLDPEESMMIGNDTESDVRVALSCGVTGCLLNTYHLSDKEIRERLNSLKKEYPGTKTEVIRSGRLSDLPGLLV
ncbi:MAG: HAD family hydrolase [Lachnospiraceae bacterium]|jgi:putative hydrolase of the HAD superfamily|nr:HAD family hydrolase [Lachnospiraceae bacterium]MEE3461433.1 HAD family hydrolase [Lachnospiraceae bacterium]